MGVVVVANEIDIQLLEIGDTIPAELLERTFGEEAGTDRYRLKCLTLRERIKRRFRAKGRAISVRVQRSDIRILDRISQACFAPSEFDTCLTRLKTYNEESFDVRPEELPSDMRSRHEHRCLSQSRILQAIKLAKNG